MKKAAIIMATILTLAPLALADSWSIRDKAMMVSYLALTIVDHEQAMPLQRMRQRNHNPMFQQAYNSHGSTGAYTYRMVEVGATWWVLDKLPRGLRQTALFLLCTMRMWYMYDTDRIQTTFNTRW